MLIVSFDIFLVFFHLTLNGLYFLATDVHSKCDMEGGSWMPQIVLFISQLVEGVSKTLYHTLGISYMDDNIRKSKIPAIISKFQFR